MALNLDSIEPDKVDRIIALLLGLPGKVLDHIFALYEGVNRPIEPQFKYLCLMALAFGGLVICYRFRRNFISWFMGLYLLLILLSGFVTITIPVIDYFFPPTIKVRGEIRVYSLIKAQPSDAISGDWRSNDCGVNATREIQRCGPQGQPLTAPFNLNVTSANCGSNVENFRQDPSNPSCMIVRERLQGCGNQNILGIKNCKGRGWLAYVINTAGRAQELKLIASKDIDLTEPFSGDLEIEIPVVPPSDEPRIVKYNIEAQVGSSPAAQLSEQNPVSNGIQSDATKSQILIYRSRNTIPKQ